jgi:DNA-binding winged helix-turn-helix (wHTH) protein
MPSGGASELYRVGDLLVDVTGASVSRHGERLVLPPRTFELLVALVRHYPCTVRRHDLLDTVWPDETVSDQTLSHRVMVLRKALGDHAEEPSYVGGERGFGYRLLAPVERMCPGEPDPRAPPGAASGVPRHRRARIAATAAIGVALFGAALRTGHRAEPQLPSSPASEVNPHARIDRLCLRGEFYVLTFTEGGLRRSAEAWEQAVTLAPGHARAQAGRALTGGIRALLDQVPPAEAEHLVRDGARRALELDAAYPAARLAAGLVQLLFDWDEAGAAAAARAAISADPDDPRGPIVLALALLSQGRIEESERVLEAATLDDPHSTAAAYLEGRAHQMRARWADAVAAYSRALELEPDLELARRGSAECLTAEGRRERALAVLGVVDPGPDPPEHRLRAAWSRLCRDGRITGEALRACVLGGDPARAERLLAEAVALRSPFVVLTPHEALLQPLRQGAVMRGLIARLQQHPPS